MYGFFFVLLYLSELVNKWKDTVKHNEKEVDRVKEEEARQMQVREDSSEDINIDNINCIFIPSC